MHSNLKLCPCLPQNTSETVETETILKTYGQNFCVPPYVKETSEPVTVFLIVMVY